MKLFARTGWRYPILVIAIVAGAIALRIADPLFLQKLRLIAFDSYQRLEPAEPNPDSPVRVVTIDNRSLEMVGPWPWPRDVMAQLLTRLADQGAVVVAFGVLFPDRGAPADDALATGLAAVPTVLSIAPTDQPVDEAVSPPRAAIVVAGGDPLPFVPGFANGITNQAALDAVAAGLGTINSGAGGPSAFRRLPLFTRIGEELLPSMAIEALRVVQGADSYTLTVSGTEGWMSALSPPGLRRIQFGDITIPTARDGTMTLGAGPLGQSAFVPAWRVLSGENDPGSVAGRIVLVGLTASGITDATLGTGDPSGQIVLQARAIEHILSGRSLVRPGEALAIELAVFLLVAGVIAWLLPRLGLVGGGAVGLGAVALVVFAAWLSFHDYGLILDPVWPALSLWVLAALVTLYLRHRHDVQRADIERVFGDGLAPGVVDAVFADPARVAFGGEPRDLTVLSCRIGNLATMAGQMDAKDLIALAGRIHTVVNQGVAVHRGTMSRSAGDTILAFWNAPLDDDEHAANACRAAVAVIRNLGWLGPIGAADGTQLVPSLGFGIATGTCSVGALDIAGRSTYSAIGEAVHLAARFQGLARFYGVPVVVGESTVRRMHDPRVLELDLVRVTGRRRPVRLFTPLEALDGDPAALDHAAAAQARLVSAYRDDRDWDEAEAALEACVALRIDSLAWLNDLYGSRLAMVRDNPPPADWDGTDVTARL